MNGFDSFHPMKNEYGSEKRTFGFSFCVLYKVLENGLN